MSRSLDNTTMLGFHAHENTRAFSIVKLFCGEPDGEACL